MNYADNSLPPNGSNLRQAFEALVSTLGDQRISYTIIGGIALIQHARVRTTDDIDALLIIPQLAMPSLFDTLYIRAEVATVTDDSDPRRLKFESWLRRLHAGG